MRTAVMTPQSFALIFHAGEGDVACETHCDATTLPPAAGLAMVQIVRLLCRFKPQPERLATALQLLINGLERHAAVCSCDNCKQDDQVDLNYLASFQARLDAQKQELPDPFLACFNRGVH